MHSLERALELVRGSAELFGVERVPIDLAKGRVLRETLVSESDFPGADVSAMDGYALGARVGGGVWRVVREARAGEVGGSVLRAGEAVRVFTGGGVPEGAESVLPQEDAEVLEDGNAVRVGRVRGDASYIRRRGENIREGGVLVEAGTRLGTGHLTVAGLSGRGEVLVTREISIFHITTGDELVGVGEAMRTGGVRDTNAVLVRGLFGGSGRFEQVRLGDEEERLAESVAGALGAGFDLVLISGGAGAGAFDFGWRALERNGFDQIFRGVAMKPGKPVIYGRRAECSAFVLPGNPLSHFVVLQTLVAGWLRGVSGEVGGGSVVRLPLREALDGGVDSREILWPGRWCFEGGRPMVEPCVWQSSGDVTGLGGVDVLIRLPVGTGRLEVGTEVTCVVTPLV